MNKRIFIWIGIFWLVLIGGFVGFKEFTLRTGEEVILKTVPVDPRDLFRGDYVILRYVISELAAPEGVEINDKVYVALQDGTASGPYLSPPEEDLFIKGKVTRIRNSKVNIEYGIESYFVPEGRGREIERETGGSLRVKASIDRFGNAVIKSLLLDGREVSFD